jgi:hypothetical protein
MEEMGREIMTMKLYRMYNGVKADDNYIFSVIAGENEVYYVVPENDVEYNSIFNQDRIKDLVLNADKENIPTDPDGWALLATYNAGIGMELHPEEATDTEDIESLIEDEQEYANALGEKYAYLKENQ